MIPSKTPIISEKEIHDRIQELGSLIRSDYSDSTLLVIGILNGSFVFLADLVRAIALPMEIDFLRVTSYGTNTRSSGAISLIKEPEREIKGKDILLVEDIVDTGTTVAWLSSYFADQAARSVRLCALIDKQERRVEPVRIDYKGFTIDRGFLVGYGLDYAEQYRNLPAIYALEGS